MSRPRAACSAAVSHAVPTLRRCCVRCVSSARRWHALRPVVAEHYGDLVNKQRANGVDEESIAESLVESFNAEELAALIVYSATVHLRAALWLRLARDLEPDLLVAIGFADLAGYTALSAELDADHLGDFVARWEEVVYDTVAIHGGRVVKTIGDEAMFAGLSASVASIALALRAAAVDHGLPAVRTGWRPAWSSRATATSTDRSSTLRAGSPRSSRPAQIYASQALRDQLAGDPSFTWSAVGSLDLRSIGPVEVFALNSSADRH